MHRAPPCGTVAATARTVADPSAGVVASAVPTWEGSENTRKVRVRNTRKGRVENIRKGRVEKT